jgi:chemotaxis protein CheC
MTAPPAADAWPDAPPGGVPADDPRALTAVQRDALREVANIGAGHAATALSQMTAGPIMISVPTVHVTPLAAVAAALGAGAGPVAAVLMDVMGDLTGRTLLVFPKATVMRVAERMLRRPPGSSVAMGALERSAVTEAGNILSGAYLNALSDFMGLVLLPSPPVLTIDAVEAVVTPAFLRLDASGYVFVVETEFFMQDVAERMRGFFLLLPDPASLRAILRATRVA